MIKKRILIILSILVVAVASTCVVLAEGSEEYYCNKYVACVLETDFSIIYWTPDYGTAVTSWSGGYNNSVEAKLYCRDTAFSSFTELDSDVDATYARVRDSSYSVWEFKSKHYGVSDSDGERTFLTDFTDW